MAISLIGTLPLAAQNLNPSDDTFITTHPDLGGEISNHGSDSFLYLVGDNYDIYVTNPLVKFDLSSYSGYQVQQDGVFTIHVSAVKDLGGERLMDLHQVYVPWTENSVTWNNFGDEAGIQFGSDASLAALDSQSLDPDDIPLTYHFNIPKALIQSWIDSPETNYGLLIHLAEGSDVNFDSSEFANAIFQPTLNFVPEPSSSLLLCGSAVLLATRRRRESKHR